MDAEAINEAREAVRAVVGEVLEREADARDWAAWAAAGLTALPVPEEYGGEGLGLAEVAVLLREAGRRAVQVGDPVLRRAHAGVVRHRRAAQGPAPRHRDR